MVLNMDWKADFKLLHMQVSYFFIFTTRIYGLIVICGRCITCFVLS